jgi:hypothetical protein
MLRLAMFKIFYRSEYEYASPLLLASNVSLALLQKFQDLLLQWINYGHTGSSINHAVTGIPPIAHRMLELTMRFQYFLRTMHTKNPLRSLLTHLQWLPTPSSAEQRHLLYSLIHPSPMYQNTVPKHRKYYPGYLIPSLTSFWKKGSLSFNKLSFVTSIHHSICSQSNIG